MDKEKLKQFREEMSRLAEIAHKREGEKELNKLLENFNEWKSGTLDYNELAAIINETHHIINRNIWKAHDFDDEFIVIRAIYKKIIPIEEMSEELYGYLKEKIERLRSVLGGQDE